MHDDFQGRGYFQEAFGYHCIDEPEYHAGILGSDIEAGIFFRLRKHNIWPFRQHEGFWEEDDLFDVVELLFDLVSKPVRGRHHAYGGCGMHWTDFDQFEGQFEFRQIVNQILCDFEDGYELGENGEIMRLAPKPLQPLLVAKIPRSEELTEDRISEAISKFRRHNSSIADRRDAVRNLADVLELLQPQMKKVLNRKDESALFEIANKFGIRYLNSKQQLDYDEPIWLSWMFYFYLATIHAVLRMIEKSKKSY